MSKQPVDPLWQLMGILFRAHPWHGVPIGEQAPNKITCYIEVVPSNQIKYELDKLTGILRVDRLQKYSNVSPTPYGFIPQTRCAETVAAFCEERLGMKGLVGDEDPLDVCVLTEKNIEQSDLLLQAYPIGGLRMLDGNEADDKIIAVLEDDAVYGQITEIAQLPLLVLDRIKHYFLTYKEVPGEGRRKVVITDIYGRDEAYEVITRSQADYKTRFGNVEELLTTCPAGVMDYRSGKPALTLIPCFSAKALRRSGGAVDYRDGPDVMAPGRSPSRQSTQTLCEETPVVETISTVQRSLKGKDIEIICLRGRLDAVSAPELREEFREFIASGHNRLVLELSGVSFIDSSGISVIITLLKAATAQGGDVVVAKLTPAVKTILELTRLNKVFRAYDDVDLACESFSS